MTTLLSARAIALDRRLAPTSLELRAGELVGVVGRNGAGKTSLLHALATIGGATGEVFVAGAPLRSLGPLRRPSALGFLPAGRELAWPLAVADLIALGLGAPADDLRVTAAIARFALDELAHRPADRLSTGERSRAMLARALAPNPPVLLLDEPLAHLDPDWQLRLCELLRADADAGKAVLLTLHDLALAERLPDRLLVVAQGRVIADGAPAEVMQRREVWDSFGLRRAGAEWLRA